jgi:3-deoxy-manno-octulosonate cytidylyltransferase (CMP-KDO synthetase)
VSISKVIGIIPARYHSTRFLGKPLIDINGKTMIHHVYENALKTNLFQDIYVATDHPLIVQEVENFGGKVLLTSLNHTTGTERCAEALNKINTSAEIVVNIQGDEPFLKVNQIKLVIQAFEDDTVEIATLRKKIYNLDEINNPNRVKVVCDLNNWALYFSRSAIPFLKNEQEISYKHIGLYAYQVQTLKKIVTLQPSPLEKSENLEQLRWLENGYKIKVMTTEEEAESVDTPEDLEKLLKKL